MVELWVITVSSQTCEAIGKFTVAWAQIETVFFNECYTANISKNIVVNNTTDSELKSTKRIRELLLKNSKEFVPDCNAERSVCERLKIRDNESHYKKYIDCFLNENCSPSEEIISCIYIGNRIRNNLLHGIKDFKNLDDQRDIFETFYCFL